MPITLRKINAQVKDPNTGEMIPAGILSSDSLTTIAAAENSAITRINNKKTEAINQITQMEETIPEDYADFAAEAAYKDMIAQTQAAMTATKAYTAGEYICVNKKLYKTTTAITSGLALVVGTNVEEVKLTESVSASAAQIATNTSDISDLKESLSDLDESVKNDIYIKKDEKWKPSNNFSTGWKVGYWNGNVGEEVTYTTQSTSYMCAHYSINPNRYEDFDYNEIKYIVIIPPTGYAIRVHEINRETNLITEIYGHIDTQAHPELAGKEVIIKVKNNHSYAVSMGRFNRNANEYVGNQTFIDSILLYFLFNSIEKKTFLPKTGEYEFFTVQVERPLAFNGEETNSTVEEVECVLRLPDSYTNYGKPTRLILACHGASGYIMASTNTWYNENWKTFMDSILDAGYAVFDANVLPTSTGTEQMGYAVGSPLYVNVLKKAYDYIQTHYNVYTQIFAHGSSMGGVGATAFTHSYPELVIAESSFAGRDMLRYLYYMFDDTLSEKEHFAISYGYTSYADLTADKFSHAEGCSPGLSLIKYVNGIAQIPPDRKSDYTNWLAYFGEIANLNRAAEPGIWMGRRMVPYKAWNSWTDSIEYTKLEEVLQQIYNRGNSSPYYAISYENGTHTQMSYGQINDMIPQLIAWYKRWE